MNQDKTLAQAAAEFLASLKPDQRQDHHQEVNKFIRWCGTERPLQELSAQQVSKYAGSLDSSSPNAAKNAASVKAFLSYTRKQGLIESNLAVHLRVKKTSTKQSTPIKQRRRTITMTAEGYRELETELTALKSERPRIADTISKAAADKDFRENAPLHAAKEQQGMVEARIRELEADLNSAVVSTDKGDGERVSLGSTITLRDLSHNEDLRYTLVDTRESSPARGKLSVASPTGKALMGRAQGDIIEVKAPAGMLRYRIETIEE
jgi:transcription elongation factor GreA